MCPKDLQNRLLSAAFFAERDALLKTTNALILLAMDLARFRAAGHVIAFEAQVMVN